MELCNNDLGLLPRAAERRDNVGIGIDYIDIPLRLMMKACVCCSMSLLLFFKRNDKMEAELRGFQVADYVSAPSKERQDEDDESADDYSGQYRVVSVYFK